MASPPWKCPYTTRGFNLAVCKFQLTCGFGVHLSEYAISSHWWVVQMNNYDPGCWCDFKSNRKYYFSDNYTIYDIYNLNLIFLKLSKLLDFCFANVLSLVLQVTKVLYIWHLADEIVSHYCVIWNTCRMVISTLFCYIIYKHGNSRVCQSVFDI